MPAGRLHALAADLPRDRGEAAATLRGWAQALGADLLASGRLQEELVGLLVEWLSLFDRGDHDPRFAVGPWVAG